MRPLTITFSVLLLLIMFQNTSASSDNINTPTILYGLTGVEIYIENMDQIKDVINISKAELQKDILERLKSSGIRILESDEAAQILGLPTLNININKKKYSAHKIVYSIEISLREIVKLERDNRIHHAITWLDRKLGVINLSEGQVIREKINQRIENFINLYYLANPNLEKAVNLERLDDTLSLQNRISKTQEQLQVLGFTPGQVDGQLGEQTQEAIRRYQQSLGLPMTGTLDDATWLSISMPWRIQQRLQEAGFDPGPIDGRLGPQTRLALHQYQNTHGLPMTGVLDIETRKSLNLEIPTIFSKNKN